MMLIRWMMKLIMFMMIGRMNMILCMMTMLMLNDEDEYVWQ